VDREEGVDRISGSGSGGCDLYQRNGDALAIEKSLTFRDLFPKFVII